MSAIKINVVDGTVSLDYEAKTPENIKSRLYALKERLNVTWYGVAIVFGLQPTEGSVRLFRRWYKQPDQANYQEMPESQWKLLLMLTDGQDKL